MGKIVYPLNDLLVEWAVIARTPAEYKKHFGNVQVPTPNSAMPGKSWVLKPGQNIGVPRVVNIIARGPDGKPFAHPDTEDPFFIERVVTPDEAKRINISAGPGQQASFIATDPYPYRDLREGERLVFRKDVHSIPGGFGLRATAGIFGRSPIYVVDEVALEAALGEPEEAAASSGEIAGLKKLLEKIDSKLDQLLQKK